MSLFNKVLSSLGLVVESPQTLTETAEWNDKACEAINYVLSRRSITQPPEPISDDAEIIFQGRVGYWANVGNVEVLVSACGRHYEAIITRRFYKCLPDWINMKKAEEAKKEFDVKLALETKRQAVRAKYADRLAEVRRVYGEKKEAEVVEEMVNSMAETEDYDPNQVVAISRRSVSSWSGINGMRMKL